MTALIILVIFMQKKNEHEMISEEAGTGLTSQFAASDSKRDPVYPLFVGDSRTVGMAAALDEQIDYHAQNGSSISYLLSLDDRIRSSGSDCIVIGFGVNDLNDAEDYADYANTLGRQLDKPVYFLTVNPVNEDMAARNGYHIKNSSIDEFNKTIESLAEDYSVIDTNGFMQMAGFNTLDGLHYDKDTYIMIYNYVMRQITEFL